MSEEVNYVLDSIFTVASGAIVALMILIIVLWQLFKINIPNFQRIQDRIDMLSKESKYISDPNKKDTPLMVTTLGVYPMNSIIAACVVFISIFAGIGIISFILNYQFERGFYEKLQFISLGGVIVLSLIIGILWLFYKSSIPTNQRIIDEYNDIFRLNVNENNTNIWTGFQYLMVLSIISLFGSIGVAAGAFILKYTITETVAVGQEITGGGRRRNIGRKCRK